MTRHELPAKTGRMKCPQCGYEPPIGRPKVVDDARVAKMRAKGTPFREIAEKLEVSLGAVQAADRRNKAGKAKRARK
jgi:hypothetical protein